MNGIVVVNHLLCDLTTIGVTFAVAVSEQRYLFFYYMATSISKNQHLKNEPDKFL